MHRSTDRSKCLRRRGLGLFGVTLCLTVAAWSQSARAEETAEVEKAVKQAIWLKKTGHLEEAKELLSRTSEAHPESELVAMARADLYLAANNRFWALKVLGEHLAQYPHACGARALSARVQISEANLDQAQELLSDESCQKNEADAVRILLLRAEIAELRERTLEAKALVAQAQGHSRRYAEDDDRLAKLERAYDPYRLPLWTAQLSAGTGYTSTSMAQVPLEFVAPIQTKATAFASFQGNVKLVVPYRRSFRPTAEFEYVSVESLSHAPLDLSVRQPTLRLGAIIGEGKRTLSLNYAYDLVDFDGARTSNFRDGWFSSSHRGTYQWAIGNGLLATGHFGYRSFEDSRLSRFESEHGAYQTIALSNTLRVGFGAALRTNQASHRAFDQVGANSALGLNILLPKGFELTESVALAYDRYPQSEGYYAPRKRDRRERLSRVWLTLLSPAVSELRLALSYGYVNRDSNVRAFDYSDQRVLIELRYQLSHDDWRSKRIGPQGRIPLRHETELPTVVTEQEVSVRERLRQDEELRKGSSCLK